jgi:hypothetical protein
LNELENMSHQDFDEKVRQSLENATSNIHFNSTWERLAQRLEAETPNDKQSDDALTDEQQTQIEENFDQHIRTQIERSNTPKYEYRYWLSLAERLDEQEERLAWLYRHKLAEVSILILLLLAFVNVLNVPIDKIEALAAPILKYTHPTPSTEENIFNNKPIEPFIVATSPITTQQEEKISNAVHTRTTPTRHLPISVLKKLDRKIAPVPLPQTQQVKSECITVATQLPSRTMKALTIKGNNTDDAYYLYAPQKEKNHYWSLGFVAVMNINEIHTPNDFFLGRMIDAYTNYSVGGGGGFTLSKENKKQAWETGVVYLTKKYQPKQISVVGTNNRGIRYEETLRDVQVNLLEIPFTYRYKFLRKQKFDYFASLGSTLNIVTQANYDNNRTYDVPAYALTMLDRNQQPSEIKQLKKFNDGLFEGGSVQDNTYFTAQAALGWEYKFSPRFSFFNQATYQRHLTLKGIGPNNNSFHAYSLWVGLKTNF